MKTRIRLILIPVFLWTLSLSLGSQSLPSVAAFSLTARDASDSAAKISNDVVFSFIRELRTYRIVDLRTEPLPVNLGVPDGMDYIFYGTLESVTDGIRLELVLKGGPWAVTRKISRVYDSMNRILLESRMLVRDLFDQSVALPDPEPEPSASARVTEDVVTQGESGGLALEAVTNLDSLAGSWKGEKGVEKILILRGGRGVAIFESGVSVSLELSILNEDLFIRQKGPVTARQFADLPDFVARQAAAIAPPLEWRLKITHDQKTLSGIKKTVSFQHDGKQVLSMDGVDIAVRWDRDSR
jgi:hypothetical protein